MRLSEDHLEQLPEEIERPRYDRSALTPGIVHIGVGNFHRAHQAWYLHRLMQLGQARDWAILGAGVRDYDADMRNRLIDQDCLTTLVELDPAQQGVEVIGSMIGYLPIAQDNGPLIAAMADPAIRIVSLTVTEGGYYLDASGGFDTAHPDIQHDVAHPGAPRTAFGAMVAALARRRAAGEKPFTALSCDNLQGNGAILRACVTGLARLADPALAEWIAEEGAFPNSMVDCIVPATGRDLVARLEALGISDAAPVSHESFRQWVIEDRFCAGRPALEAAGATVTSDVHAYEAQKLRILNAGHQLLANAGEILSVPTIAAAMQDAEIAAFFQRVQREEILPHVAPVPDMTPREYLALVTRRFSNPMIHDTIRRVAFDGSSRHAGFLHPVIREALAAGSTCEGLALAEALWARMCAGTREDGSLIEPNDPHWDSLAAAARVAREDPSAWLAQTAVYGDLGADPGFAEAFGRWLEAVWRKGTRTTLATYAAS